MTSGATVRPRFRGPFARWPRAADAVLAVVVLLATTFVIEGPGDTMVGRSLGEVPLYAVAVFAVTSAALYWRRSQPLRVVAVVLIGYVVLLGSGFADVGIAVIIALYSAGKYMGRDVVGEAAAFAAAVVAVIDGLVSRLPIGEIVAAVVVMVGAWYFGRSRRLRAERAEQLLREEETQARRIVVEERTRIARELHDVVAHRVSLMTVQAGAAKTIVTHDPAAAMDAMTAVEEAGRQALDELRHLLGVLRPEVDDTVRGPQPGLGDVPGLVERVRAAGLEVTVTMQDLPAEVPARVELSAYRIVQEALTNVLKHGGAGASVAVHVRGTATGLAVEVLDDGAGAAEGRGGIFDDAVLPTEQGHGILGMRERALLLGGSLEAGPRPDGGYRVAAHLPAQRTGT